MNGTDGKPFKTREGGVLKLHDLIEMTRDKARQRLHEAGLGAELSPDEFEATAHKVAVAALKFADLSNFRGTSYVFDLDRFFQLRGQDGPLPALPGGAHPLAPTQGRRAGRAGRRDHHRRPRRTGVGARARRLVGGADGGLRPPRPPTRSPSTPTASPRAFSKFYAACPVLAADTPSERGSRLAISETVLKQLTLALDLLGIETPERM